MAGNRNSVHPQVRSLILCDRVYRDVTTAKFVLAGIFNNIFVPKFPWAHAGGCAIYCAVTGIHGPCMISLTFREASSDTVLMEAHLPLDAPDPLATVEAHMELPPLPLPQRGTYCFQVNAIPGGEFLTSIPVRVAEHQQPPAEP
jgi:hypothetical protein